MKNLGHSCLLLLHQLVHVLLVLLQTRLQVVLFSLQSADLFLQLRYAQRKRDVTDVDLLEYNTFQVICPSIGTLSYFIS